MYLFYTTSLVQYSLLSSKFCRSTVEMGSTVFSAPGLTRSKARRQPAWTPYLGLWTGMSFQAHSGCGKNPALCGCRMEVSIFLLSAGSPLLYLRAPAYLTTTSLFPPASSSNQQHYIQSEFKSLSILLLLHPSHSSQRKFSAFKSLCD